MRKYLLVLFVPLFFSLTACNNNVAQVESLNESSIQSEANVNQDHAIDKELEDIYQSIIKKDYLQADKLLNNTKYYEERPDYKVLSNYKNAMRTKHTIEDENKKFQYLVGSMIGIPNDYKGIHSIEILEEKKLIASKIEQIASSGDLDTLAKLFSSSRNENSSYTYSYISFLRNKENDFSGALNDLYKIPDSYNSFLADEITQAKNLYRTTFNEKVNKSKTPKVGMTKEEVLNSAWGKPNSINKTTTASGEHEQWVYSIKKYVYFDNGYVTAIQE
ncbi:hypothetical protein [Brevibacillus laterosporus]|uniref:Lipoprotein n=1 Tax=Brevibacillus laterosporus TaxID=1465 RepID=A0AAP8QGT3_BRELA|nr:hypothetical protein [Brevibacillus laterosporus]MBG9776212.1 hypothetical protein [Brevibacillus laterosporus]PPB12820.1 hypothetical protein C4A77_00100 [Brevibacillus laterosporus]